MAFAQPYSPPPSPATRHLADRFEGLQDGINGGPNFMPIWTVTPDNYKAVKLALQDRKPADLRIVTHDDHDENLSVDQITSLVTSEGAEGCGLKLCFYDSFYNPTDTTTDQRRLEPILANERLHLTTFYGHLDLEAVDTLPTTIHTCGLAIGDAADAETLHKISPWLSLRQYFVSVSPTLSPRVLKPLPINVDDPVLVKTNTRLGLVFPRLSDDRLDFMRAAINALVPHQRIQWLDLPQCKLTPSGGGAFIQKLYGVEVRESITVEVAGSTWTPGDEEREKMEDEYNQGAHHLYDSPRYLNTDLHFY